MGTTNKIRKYNIKDFYEAYPNKDKFFAFQLGIKTRKKKTKANVPFKLYRKIVLLYFEIYFNDLYYLKGKSYFLFTGYLEIILSPIIDKKKRETVTLLWTERPNRFFVKFVNLLKIPGTTARFRKLETVFYKVVNVDSIPRKVDRESLKIAKKNIYY